MQNKCSTETPTASLHPHADELAAEGLRPASPDDSGWYVLLANGRRVWATDEPAPAQQAQRDAVAAAWETASLPIEAAKMGWGSAPLRARTA